MAGPSARRARTSLRLRALDPDAPDPGWTGRAGGLSFQDVVVARA